MVASLQPRHDMTACGLVGFKVKTKRFHQPISSPQMYDSLGLKWLVLEARLREVVRRYHVLMEAVDSISKTRERRSHEEREASNCSTAAGALGARNAEPCVKWSFPCTTRRPGAAAWLSSSWEFCTGWTCMWAVQQTGIEPDGQPCPRLLRGFLFFFLKFFYADSEPRSRRIGLTQLRLRLRFASARPPRWLFRLATFGSLAHQFETETTTIH